MQISECSYCGITGFTENNVCTTCLTAASLSTPPPQQEKPSGFAEESISAPPPSVSQASADEENLQNLPRPVTRIECWRCRTVNTWELTRICIKCGCALRNYSKNEATTMQGDSFTDSPAFRSFTVIVVITIVFASGFFYLMKTEGGMKTNAAVKNKSPEKPEEAEVSLPSDSWHKPSIWNFFRDTPSVEEILEKNNYVTSRTMKPSDVQTISFSGDLSFANAGCATDKCAEAILEQEKKERSYSGSYEPKKNYYAQDAQAQKDGRKVGLSNNFEQLDYRQVGKVESIQKMPDKILRKISVTPPKQIRRTETIEAFDGISGWKKTVVYDGQQIVNSSVGELMSLQLMELKNSASAWKNNYKKEHITFSKLKQINGKVYFVLQNTSTATPELLYFDAVTGFIGRSERDNSVVCLPSYSFFDGVNLPSAMYARAIGENGDAIWMKIENIVWRINAPVEDSVFARP